MRKLERLVGLDPLPVQVGQDDQERDHREHRHEQHEWTMHVEPKLQLEQLHVRKYELVVSIIEKNVFFLLNSIL